MMALQFFPKGLHCLLHGGKEAIDALCLTQPTIPHPTFVGAEAIGAAPLDESVTTTTRAFCRLVLSCRSGWLAF
jgi:hypothetical protein